MKPLCLSIYFLNINFHLSCPIDPNAAGSNSYCANSALFCQKAVKGRMIVKNHMIQGNERSQVPLRLQRRGIWVPLLSPWLWRMLWSTLD